jgi:hypothetical protein
MEIINKTRDTIIARQAVKADTLLRRMIGLLGRREFSQGEALIIKPCNSVHTLFMRFPIDIVFLDRQNKVIKLIPYLKPWRLSSLHISARLCIELPVGTIHSHPISLGDIFIFVDKP